MPSALVLDSIKFIMFHNYHSLYKYIAKPQVIFENIITYAKLDKLYILHIALEVEIVLEVEATKVIILVKKINNTILY